MNNPFLDESSGDEAEDTTAPRSSTAATTVRTPPPPVVTAARLPKLTTEIPLLSRNPPLLREETSGKDDSADEQDGKLLADDAEFDDFGDLADAKIEQLGDGQWGEEFREMRYMREQARLEEEEAGTGNGEDGGFIMEECCPVCNGSLAGLTADQATTHVNGCLDGDPIPLPKPPEVSVSKNRQEDGVESLELSKRFAKAAVPRPGQANPITLDGQDEETGRGDAASKSAFAKLMNGHAEDTAWATAAAAENASRGMPAYKRTCPFYKIMPGFFICVDAFRYGAVEGCKAYFLSHFHSDHYIGLTANWTHGPIYCSKVTGSLVKTQLKTAAQYVVELEFDEKVPVPGIEGVSVTMIDANHCPGSSLFLFEKEARGRRTHRILHCGDFRACPAHINHPQLCPETVDAATGRLSQQRIDVCYLDTTYLNPRYSFPPQDDVIRASADLCVSLNNSLVAEDEGPWNALLRRREGGPPPGIDGVGKFFKPEKPARSSRKPTATNPAAQPTAFTALQAPTSARNRLLVVCGTYSIGKERICVAIALALRTKIFATPAKMRLCRQLDDPVLASLLTEDPREAQVHMQALGELRADTLAEYLEAHSRHFGRVVGFRPSGWNFRAPGGNASASLPPTSVPMVQVLHGQGWRPSFGARDLVPQRGSGKGAMCFGVPYSEHSSFRELAMFLMALRIEKVVPTVNVGSEQSRRRMKAWTDRWLAERKRGGLVKVLIEEEGGGEGKGKKAVAMWDGKSAEGGGAYW
ncbi:DNA repair metallo-beta-lactamase-domain-containing protein [Schizothecium vesticola]|uniref:DNA repair metallo-beta-lactamase-domain-containing protein n=1 Tax=Schizothecium vesticola TaxID=314040 RepID=A0AA40KAF5_9PEZI|nr:DNA repair metallo-beta-lactamase-domain-containing protein [Schizothecium vesticola]